MLAAAAAPAFGATGQVSATPDSITVGKASQITLHLSPGAARAGVAVTPWQPTVAGTAALDHKARALAAGNGVLAVAGDNGVVLLDGGAASGTELGRFPIDDTCPALRVHGDVAYVACRDTGLWLVDIHNPRVPRRLARIHALSVTDFAVAGKYLAVLHGKFITTYDVGVPAKPRQVAEQRLDAPGRALAAGAHTTVFAALGSRGLAAFQVQKDGRLAPRGRYVTTAAAVNVAVADGLAYVALGSRGVIVLDVTDPMHLHWRGSYHRLGRVWQMAATGDRLYAADRASRVYVLDVRRPGRPNILAARRFSGPVRAVAATGRGRAWVLTPHALDLTDFSGSVPAYSNENFDVGEGVNFGGIRRGVIRGNVVYTADWFSGIHLFDIKDPTHPRLLSSLHIPGSAKGIVVKGDYAFVADDDHGLQVVDISDPFRPADVARLNTPGLAYIPFLAGDRLYLASHGGGFQIIDVSRPRKPRLLASQSTPDRAWAVRVRAGTAYVADDAAGLLTFDVHDPRHIRPLGAFRPGGYAEDVVVHGGYVLVAFFDQGLYVVDIRDPRHPKAVAHLALPGNTRGIDVQGKTAYIADWLAGVQTVDITDPRHPRLLGGYDTDGAAWGVRVRGSYAYVMDWWGGFTVLNISNPRRPRLAGRYQDRGRTCQALAGKKFLYVASGKGGLQVFDRKTPLNPIWVTGLDLKGRTSALWLHRPYLYAAGEGGGLTVIDDRDPYQPRPLGRLDLNLDSPLLAGDDQGHLYLYSRGTGISVIDASHPRSPRRVAVIGTPANGLWVMHGTLYVATPRHGVQGYDITEPARPRPKVMWAAPGPATAVTGSGSRLFLAVAGKGVYTLEENGDALAQTALFPLPAAVADMAVAQGHLLVSQRRGGLWDFAIEPDGRLRSTAFYPILHTATRLSAAGATAYVGGGAGPTAVAWWPGLAVSAPTDRGIRLTLSAKLPRGDYGVELLSGDGHHTLTPRAFRVHLPRHGEHPFTMKDFRKAYKRWRRKHP